MNESNKIYFTYYNILVMDHLKVLFSLCNLF